MYVCVDSSILIDVVKHNASENSMAQLEEIQTMMVKGEVTLLVPDITLMEVRRHLRHQELSLKSTLKSIATITNDKSRPWNEASGLVDDLSAFLDTWLEKKCKECNERGQFILALFGSPPASRLPLNIDLWFKAKQRLIEGGMPRNEPRNDQDAMIVEALTYVGRGDKELSICSRNVADFALETKDGYILHPVIEQSLPNATLFTTLKSMLEVLKGKAKPPKPSRNEVQEALEKAQEKLEEHVELRDIADLRNFLTHNVKTFLVESETEKREKQKEIILGLIDLCRSSPKWDELDEPTRQAIDSKRRLLTSRRYYRWRPRELKQFERKLIALAKTLRN